MASEIWICEHQKVVKWNGGIQDYKTHLKAKVMREANRDAKCKSSSSLVLVLVLVLMVT